MKRKLIGIFICMMFILFPSLSASETINDDKSIKEISYDQSDLVNKIISRSSTSGYWLEQDKMVASDGATWDWFSFSVSIYGDYALIGAHYNYCGGSAYIFKRNGTTWNEEQKLTASDGAVADSFGRSVSMDGDYAIIGAPGDDAQKGSVYVFKRNDTTWNEAQKLTASDGASGDSFGYSVSMDGDYAIIGAEWDDNSKGSAYIFKRDGTNWTQQAKLTASDGASGDDFGCSVSIYGDYALIGAEDAHFGIYDTGKAYIFKRSDTNWTEKQRLYASDKEDGDDFGRSVSIYGDYALIGASGDYCCGSTYVFKRHGSTWDEDQRLTTSDGASGDGFGCSVSMDGDYALIGAIWDDDNGHDSGSAYVFKRNPPPNEPIITWPKNGITGVKYQYNFSLTDADGDPMYLRVDWGNGTAGPWTGPYNSGTTVGLNNTWNQRGTFTIRAQAKDIYGSESKWGILEISIPRNKATYYTFFISLLGKFPILQKFLLIIS